jgi:hypothetical protein
MKRGDSFHFGAGLHIFDEGGESAHFAVARREDHALRFDAHQFGRFQIRYDDDGFSDQCFRLVFLADAGDDLPLFAAKADLELEQLFGFRHPFR